MGIYDIILKRIKEIQSKTKEDEPVTNISTSSMLAAEITLISSLIVASIMLRFINKALMMVAVLILILIAVIAMPIMPKLRKEQSDSFSNMLFYMILALGIIITLFYWGSVNV